MYSKISKALFYFPCILFKKNNFEANICNVKKGFKDWKNLNRIEDHENSSEHRDNFLQWKCLEKKNLKAVD